LFICSMLTYAAPVWSNTSRSNPRRLQVSSPSVSVWLATIPGIPPSHISTRP
jgi:hypothetical protein